MTAAWTRQVAVRLLSEAKSQTQFSSNTDDNQQQNRKNKLNATNMSWQNNNNNIAGPQFTPGNNNSTTTSKAEPWSELLEGLLQRQNSANNNGSSSSNKVTPSLSQAECDAVLAQCVAHDAWDAVWQLLEQVYRPAGLTQVRSTYQTCLQACADRGNGAAALAMFQAYVNAGFGPSSLDTAWTVQAIITTTKTKSSKSTETSPLLLDASSLKLLWESLKSGKQWKQAMQLLRFLEEESAATATLTSTNNTQLEPSLSTYRAVMDCCLAAGQVEPAVQVLHSSVRRGLVPTLDDLERLVQILSRQLQWRRALQVLELMDDLRIPKTLSLYNSVLTACAKAKEVVQAKFLLVQMRNSGIAPDIYSYNAVLSACASAGQWNDAMRVLDQCHREPGVTPDIYTYTNAIRACAKGGKVRRALALLQVVKDKRLPLDTYCYTAAIEACAKASMWKKALELLEEMEQKKIPPSEVTYSVTITACGNGGEWQKALDLLQLMREKKMSIHLITYNAAITALAKAAKQSSKDHRSISGSNSSTVGTSSGSELWIKALELLEQMKSDGLEPDGFSFCSAISCCGAQGRWEESLELMKVMQEGGPRLRPNKIAYTATIASCGRSGQVDHAMRLFRQMKEQGLSADRVAYNALFLAIRVAKRAEAAAELWDEMLQQAEATRPAGTAAWSPRRMATAQADTSSTPDIITVTEAIGAMSSSSSFSEANIQKIDQIFVEAVRRGILFQSTDSLKSANDFDLSGMTLPVARAACRYLVHRYVTSHAETELADLTLITGIGIGKGAKPMEDSRMATTTDESFLITLEDIRDEDASSRTSLRDYVQQILSIDFDPPLAFTTPRSAQGTVVIERDALVQLKRNLVK